MAIGVRDRKLLWGRSGNQCAFEGCNRMLVVGADESDRDAVVGQEAHIVGRSPEGPRGHAPDATPDDSYENLILLCADHHKVVDDDPQTWTVDRLQAMKAEHEQRVGDLVTDDQARAQEIELFYAETLAEWEDRFDIDGWNVWTAGLLFPTPHIAEEALDALDEARLWLLSRDWPGALPRVESAFANFRAVADDLAMVCRTGLEHRVEGDDELRLVPQYKRQWVADDEYRALSERFDWTVDLIHDLVVEVTRAANAMLAAVQATLDTRYRRAQGLVTVDRPGSGLFVERYVPTYGGSQSYPGLRAFTRERASRDVFFGAGENPSALAAVTYVDLDDSA